jgi:hypothetical protein
MAAKEPARAINRAMVMGAHVVRVMSGWHRSIVPTTELFPPLGIPMGRYGAAGLQCLKAAQCEGSG